jgi:hypothetical protein
MRVDITTGALAGAFVVFGSASLYANTALQFSAAAGDGRAAVVTAAANPQPDPLAYVGEVAAGSAMGSALPTRVGRVSLVSGKVQFRAPGDMQWSLASVNDPIATGVAVNTDPQARAEISIGAHTIDLAAGTEIAIVKLDQQSTEIAVKQGRIASDLRALDPGETVRIDIPAGAVRLLSAGRYDIDVGGGEQPTRLAAFAGSAEFADSDADLEVGTGERVAFSTAGPIAATFEPAADDEFTKWCRARAADETRMSAPYFISRAMTGYAALADAGQWRSTEKYGEVWQPKLLPAGWAPYRDGHWRWLAPWGWSWVDKQVWGFAPSHYGRWLFADGRWSWVPGRFAAHPVWAPAVVGFLGTPGVGLSYADGPGPAIAWFPLAPGEIYWPGYTGDLDYIRALNRDNVMDLSAIRLREDGEPPAAIVNAPFVNRAFASVVPRRVFTASEPIATALLTIPSERLRDAPAIMGSPQVGPPPSAPAHIVAVPAREPQSPVVARSAKIAAWAAIVHAAAMRSRNYQEAARQRFIRLRVFSGAETSRPRHSIVLRVARSDHALIGSKCIGG